MNNIKKENMKVSAIKTDSEYFQISLNAIFDKIQKNKFINTKWLQKFNNSEFRKFLNKWQPIKVEETVNDFC
ncbi:hypothetical protein [Mycoplasma bradburyae]|uniref:hypothetical protein n=1 Tax=Mycoplasma bradburyae TaxID=2963128 RepID=UPI00233FA519|nr:hypothetical protein [Mycoplasma bradburyae]MDC4163405.1 hypothetical protein [Mycoplasma bradburyae]MDC4184203.1 hypothetical protein [Mycoplasma bradburyae]